MQRIDMQVCVGAVSASLVVSKVAQKRGLDLKQRFIRFMQGRYGADDYSKFLVGAGLALAILTIFVRNALLSLFCWVLLLYAYFRIFSRNIQKRYQENMKYLSYKGKVRGFFQKGKNTVVQRKNFHIYTCPSCGQKIRIPRGKGKIEVRCPKCSETFVKRS